MLKPLIIATAISVISTNAFAESAIAVLNPDDFEDMETVKSRRHGEHWHVSQKKSGSLKWCQLEGEWTSGTAIIFLSLNTGKFSALVADMTWDIPPDTRANLEFIFDKKATKKLLFEQFDPEVVALSEKTDFKSYMDLLQLFAKSSGIQVKFPNGDLLQGSLAGTNKAMADWENCSAEWAGNPIQVR